MYKVINEIENLRSKLTRLILQKDNLLDPDVILLSKRLDKLLYKYYRIRSISRLKYWEFNESPEKQFNEA